MKRTVTVVRHADRHEDLHGRSFAEATELTFEDGPAAEIITGALEHVPFDLGGSFSVIVKEPHE